jgi:FAD binding domain
MAGARHFRLIGILPPPLRAKADLSLDDIAAAVAPDLSPGFAIESHGWWSRYRISHRRAAHFRNGRAFLLGDAGHIHSPAGGQGMNTGLQDACNLGWKLALVCQGAASAELLDSYAHEREGVAERLVNTTDRAFTLAVSESTVARLFRTHVAARLLGRMLRIEAVRRLAFATVSQTGIRYRDSPLSRNGDTLPDEAVQAGDRLPWMRLSFTNSADAMPAQDIYALLREPGFHLFLFAPPADSITNAQAWSAAAAIKVQLHVAPASPHNQAEWSRQGLATPRALLVRPDGHIGWGAAEFNSPAGDAWLKNQLRLLRMAH